jgi:hypothetical protein
MNFDSILMQISMQSFIDIACSDNSKVILVLLENIIMRILFKVSAAYLKMLISLLNSNQRENLVLKNG